MRVLAAAIYSALLTLPVIALAVPAPTANAAARQPGSFSSLPSRAPAASATGGISGTVTAAEGGAKLSGVHVHVFNNDGTGAEAGSATTGADGTYRVTGLTPAPAGYLVCFDPGNATGGNSRLGYLGQCYQNVPWDDYEEPAPGAAPVPVTAGRLTTAVDAAIGAAGGISGTVTAADGGARLSGAIVVMYDGSGNLAGSATTGKDGTYQITGQVPAVPGYRVCFYAPEGNRYASQCYRGVPWNPPTDVDPDSATPAPGAAPVPVTPGRLTTAVDAALDATGGISGTVTAADGGAGLGGVNVEVFSNDSNGEAGEEAGSATTGKDGTYQVTGLYPGAPGYLVCFDASGATGGSPHFGYPSRCYRNVPWEGGPDPAPGAAPVPVTAGRLTTVNAALNYAGGISGTVTAADGGGALSDVNVQVLTSSGDYAGYATTAADGTYQVTGLPSADYWVCFDPTNAAGGNSNAGYPTQCYPNAPWQQGSGPPPGATPVHVTADRLTTPVNAALNDATGISGTVTAADDGVGLNDVYVQVFTTSGGDAGWTTTAADGTYQVTGLPPAASGYLVCFDPLGYAGQCYQDVPWDGVSGPPPGSAPVQVTAGMLTPAVNVALNDAGGISGTVTAADGGGALSDVNVEVFTSSGDYDGSVDTAADGTYQLTGLDPAASGYRVCFDATYATSGSFTPGYLSQCYRNVPWAGGPKPASGATPVQVTDGRLTPVNAALGAAGGISGTVTAADGGTRLSGVRVEVFTSGGDLAGSAATQSDGTYVVTRLTPATPGYRVCFDARPETGGVSTTGYASQCYRNAPWDFGAPAAGATAVPVTAGRLTPAISAALSACEISGTTRRLSGPLAPGETRPRSG